MTTLRISSDPLEIPADFDDETDFRAKIAGHVKAFRAALSEALGHEVGIKYEIVDAAVPVVKRGRKPRVVTDTPRDTAVVLPAAVAHRGSKVA